MKRIKKLMAVMLAAIMVMSMGTSVFADDDYYITVTSAHENETYSAYKIFDATYSGDNVAYTISESSAFYSAISNATTLFTLTESTSGTYVVQKLSTYAGSDDDFAAAVVTLIQGVLDTASPSITADGTGTGTSTSTATINLTSAGYYFVTTSTGSLVSLDTAKPTASVQDKNTVPNVEKTVSNEENGTYNTSNTAGIGDTVYFKAVISDINDASNIVFHDKMDEGLTYASVTSVKLDDTSEIASGSDYTVSTSTSDDCTFEIDFSSYLSTNASSLNDSSTLVIYYTAIVSANAVIGDDGNTNTASVSYGDASESTKSTTTTKVYEVNIFKYTNADTPLESVEFVLYKDTNNYAQVENGKLTGWTDSATGSNVTLTTDSNGMIYIDGLDAGTYYLKETKTLDGYNSLTSVVTITISSDGTVSYSYESYGSQNATIKTVDGSDVSNVISIVNNTGSTLPATGGIGTTMFYIIGAILVLGAGVVLITRRRMASR